jgi:hypothetical protein
VNAFALPEAIARGDGRFQVDDASPGVDLAQSLSNAKPQM